MNIFLICIFILTALLVMWRIAIILFENKKSYRFTKIRILAFLSCSAFIFFMLYINYKIAYYLVTNIFN